MANLTLTYALESFSFLLRQGERLSGKEYADRIERHYSIENPQTASMVLLIREAVEWFECISRIRGHFRVRINDDYYNRVVNQ